MERELNPLVAKEISRLNLKLAEVEFERDNLYAKNKELESTIKKLKEQLSPKPTIEISEFTCDACGCHPSSIIVGPVGTFCSKCFEECNNQLKNDI